MAAAPALDSAPSTARSQREMSEPGWTAQLDDSRCEDGGAALYVEAWERTLGAAAPGPTRPSRARGIWTAAQTALLAVAIVAVMNAVLQGRKVEGQSMEPSLRAGQRLLINRGIYLRVYPARLVGWLPFLHGDEGGRYLFHGPRRGEVVVFTPPAGGDENLIKRVIAGPGDHLRIAGGQVYVNGRRLDEPYVRGAATACAGPWCDLTLGEDEYYVMGDNRSRSSDSRLWGPVPAGKIIGKAWLIYRPLADFGLAH